jgi:NAD(P)-dependent dehydrogenase (short-subunit alcohol dehydrogenase family)
MPQKSVLITGASSGFGRLTAELFAREGWRTFATMRGISSANATPDAELRRVGVDVVELDVTSDASVEAAAAIVASEVRALDVLVNNAGVGSFGIQEAFTPSAVERLYATNVFGPLRVNRAFLPAMRERGSGLVVYVSSVVGRIVNPFGGVYASSKWALEALAEASSYESSSRGRFQPISSASSARQTIARAPRVTARSRVSPTRHPNASRHARKATIRPT